MNEGVIELERAEEELLTADISDEALEAAVLAAGGQITFTFSFNLFYCRFC